MTILKKHIFILVFYILFTINIGYSAFWLTEDKLNKGLIWDSSWTISFTIQRVLTYLLWFLALLSVIFAIKAWFQILTAGWDEEKVKSGKKTLLFTLLGLLVIWWSWVIATWLTKWLNTL